MNTLATRVKCIQQRIEQSLIDSIIPSRTVNLLAVSKTRSSQDIFSAYQLGLRSFGENYVQEGIKKIEELSHLRSELIWHFIGPIQSNKCKLIAEHFDWVESLDRIKIAQHLNRHRSPEQVPLNVCIQINIDNEASKSGLHLDQVSALANDISSLSRLRLRGIMAIPKATSNPSEQEESFLKLYQCLQNLAKHFPDCDTLSLGMSSDLEAAIKCGSTQVRIGTDLFGPRDSAKNHSLTNE